MQATSKARNPSTALQDAPTIDFFNTTRDRNPDIGAIEYTVTLHIENEEVATIKIYPTPATHQITIEGIKYDLSKKKLYDMLGREINTIKFISNTVIDISNLSSGMYLLNFEGSAKKF
ncbi:putative secreted protein (Por secretion system target) [Kordia periserrulae]|uniref:Putative secreted protein (Por secretion system target) n=1 Tax=Kordia periserrulae TaxID=701523 RepID=A0A2T6C1Z6_9FLAO|nr:T9SS type A sorting domain-containing protein [Kordia periserrulae]PTX62267.1 putative secreted protein (Por secretion system target) [Kordia periserrulae]